MYYILEGTPEYDRIHNNINNYKSWTRGQIEDDLRANNYTSRDMNERCNWIARAVVLAAFVALTGLFIGSALALSAPKIHTIKPALIAWGMAGGITVIPLGFIGIEKIVHIYKRKQPIPESEYRELITEIQAVHTQNMKHLQRISNRTDTYGEQCKLDHAKYSGLQFIL